MISMETLLNATPGSFHDVSVVWSTSHVPGMEAAYGGYCERGCRWRLRRAAFLLAGCLAMHSRCVAAFLGGGGIHFLVLLWLSVCLLASPMRYFELYLGQWSLSGPGRAFRYTPILDGIGIGMVIACLVRAVVSSCIAASASVYVWHATSDDTLPFTYCGDKPEVDSVKECTTNFIEKYPSFIHSPAYHFFYVRVWKLEEQSLEDFWNRTLMLVTILSWLLVWALMLREKLFYGKLVWNNLHSCMALVPVTWVCVLLAEGISNVRTDRVIDFLEAYTDLGSEQVLVVISDAFEVSIYIHAVATGTEMILGKGLNHFASGHIDPKLSVDNILHSVLLTTLMTAHAFAALFCSAADPELTPHIMKDLYQQGSSYYGYVNSICAAVALLYYGKPFHECATAFFIVVRPFRSLPSPEAHSTATSQVMQCDRTLVIFGGVVISHVICSYVFLKTALHCLFEYRIKLVFHEQVLAALSVLLCIILSYVILTYGGLPAVEALDAVSSGLVLPLLCLLQLTSMLYLYGETDFVADLKAATKQNCCSFVYKLWPALPFFFGVLWIVRLAVVWVSPLPIRFLGPAFIVLALVLAAVTIRAIYNTVAFLKNRNQRS